ncbi:uncharacterized protein LOC119164529 [Rhipicephalus microplus]|uniref:uncharacterized protein LOC119164529 n=1 Tax=Rhipicephalus microplus TaxID=6941 RepID=UPI003F6CE57F
MFATTYRRTEEEEREYKRRRAEAARRRRQNLSEEQKAAERERNAAAARQRRLHQTEEQRAAERERHRARRANPQVRAAERERDAEARRRRRANPHLRAAERARRRERRLAEGVRPSSRRQRRAKARRDRRQTSERTPSSAVWSRGASSEDDFKLLLDDLGQLCSACDRLCFRHDVSEVSPRHVQTLAREFPEEENVEDFALCQACRDSLEAGSVALVARRCGYVYPPMPEWLTIISSDEEEQPVSCDVHGPMPVLTARSTQTDAVMPLSKRVDIAVGSSWIDDRGVSRSTQTSSFIAAKVHSWTATEIDGLPKQQSLLRKRTSVRPKVIPAKETTMLAR